MGYRFENRLRAYKDSLYALSEAESRDRNDSFVLSGTSAKFSITFELAWKTMKDIIIEYYDIDDFVAGSPKETLRRAFKVDLISDDRWMQMLRLRNLLAHDYDLDVIEKAFDKIIDEYIPLMYRFRDKAAELLQEGA